MFAGHDTTATTMSWALYELSQNKEAQRILREEIREIKRSVIARGDVDLTIQDIDSMKYLAAVMKVFIAILINRILFNEYCVPGDASL